MDPLEPRLHFSSAQLISNGSFSDGANGWAVSGDFQVGANLPHQRTPPGHATGAAVPGGAPANDAQGHLAQVISIPVNAVSGTLDFWHWIQTSDTAASATDTLDVFLDWGSGSIHLASLSNLDGGSGYAQATPIAIDLVPMRGQDISISLIATSDAALPTVFQLDDVSLVTTLADPVITSLTPATIDGSNSRQTLTIEGSDFIPAARVRLRSSALDADGTFPALFVDSTRLEVAAVFPTDPADWFVSVLNPDGGVSQEYPLAVYAPFPQIESIQPAAVTRGGPGFILQLNGDTFTRTSVVRWNGVDRATTPLFLQGTGLVIGLEAAISADDIAARGTADITVFSAGPGGGLSQPYTLPIVGAQLAPPSILSPGSTLFAGAGSTGATPTFRWEAVDGASGYGLYIEEVDSQGDPIGDLAFDSALALNQPLTGTSFTLPAGVLQAESRYRWRMSTYFDGGYGLERSAPRFFDVSAGPAVPELSSRPQAAAKVFLDFDGALTFTWSSRTVPALPPYSIDSNTDSFSAELAVINQVWARMAEMFSPFDIDVTTIDPTHRDDKRVVHVLMGRDSVWYSGSGPSVGGVALRNSFVSPSLSNTVHVFTSAFSGSNRASNLAAAAAHEVGHALGLRHQSAVIGGEHVEYYRGNSLIGPIMGVGYYTARPIWWKTNIFPGQNSTQSVQDDLAVLSSATNGFGYRLDDHGNAADAATSITSAANQWNTQGVIHNLFDSDWFSFTLTSPSLLQAQVQRARHLNTAIGMLNASLELRDAAGQLIASAAGTSLDETLERNLSPGTYYLAVSSHAAYGDVGQYTLSVTLQADKTAPTASFAGISPDPHTSPLSTVTIQFSEPVLGLDLDDLLLTRNGLPVSLAGATLTSLDRTHFELGNLGPLTTISGVYMLTLSAAGSGITDIAGNALTTSASRQFKIRTLFFAGSDGVDHYIIQESADGAAIEVFENSPPDGAPTYIFTETTLGQLTIHGNGGDDTLTLHIPSTRPLSFNFDGGTGFDRLAMVTGPIRQVVSVAANALTINRVTMPYAGIEDMRLSAPLADAALEILGPLPFTPLMLAAAGPWVHEVIVRAGAYDLGAYTEINTDALHLTAIGDATVTFQARRRLRALRIGDSAEVLLLAGGNNTLDLNDLWIEQEGVLDLFDNSLVLTSLAATDDPALRYAPAAYRGRNGGAWNGPGIRSTTAANTPGMGIAMRSDYRGESHPGSTLIMTYSAATDANLDGRVSIADYLRIDRGLARGKTTFSNGDFNFDEVIDAADYFLIDSTFLAQPAPAAAPAPVPPAPAAAPAPALAVFSIEITPVKNPDTDELFDASLNLLA